jgi:hypothetical protein
LSDQTSPSANPGPVAGADDQARQPGFRGELHKYQRHYGLTVTAAEALERWGAETTLDDL